MPIAGVHMRNRPSNSIQGEAASDCRIVIYVLIVVVVNEIVLKRLSKYDPNKYHQEGADDPRAGGITGASKRRSRSSPTFLDRRFAHLHLTGAIMSQRQVE